MPGPVFLFTTLTTLCFAEKHAYICFSHESLHNCSYKPFRMVQIFPNTDALFLDFKILATWAPINPEWTSFPIRELMLKSVMWKHWRSNSSFSKPMWRRRRRHPILMKIQAGWESRRSKPADIASGNTEHVDAKRTQEMFGKSEPEQRLGAKGKTHRLWLGSVWWRQIKASVLSSLPFHSLECNPKVVGPAAPLSGTRANAKSLSQKCLGCTRGYTASEFRQQCIKHSIKQDFVPRLNTENSTWCTIFFISKWAGKA